ncbi:MAG: serine/threonine-protein phosphatase [Evtepia sp.]
METFRTHLEDLRGPDLPGETGKLLLAAAEDANQVVYHKASTDDDCIGMGTTLVGLILQGETLEVVNVGDSRAYLIRPDGIRRITRDHSVVEDLIANGDLTPEQARRHPQKNLITRALGTSPRVKADLFQETVAPGMRSCCAPTVSSTRSPIRRSKRKFWPAAPPKRLCQRLVARTLDRGAPDNVTVVLFQL